MVFNVLIEIEVEADDESGAAGVLADVLAPFADDALLIVRDTDQNELDSFAMTELVVKD